MHEFYTRLDWILNRVRRFSAGILGGWKEQVDLNNVFYEKHQVSKHLVEHELKTLIFLLIKPQ